MTFDPTNPQDRAHVRESLSAWHGWDYRPLAHVLGCEPTREAVTVALDMLDAWVDKHGDVWRLGSDGLMHTPETEPFPREYVERKWGPLVLLRPDRPARPTLSPTDAAAYAWPCPNDCRCQVCVCLADEDAARADERRRA